MKKTLEIDSSPWSSDVLGEKRETPEEEGWRIKSNLREEDLAKRHQTVWGEARLNRETSLLQRTDLLGPLVGGRASRRYRM